MAIFNHRVKYNGKHYLAGENVPIEAEKSEKPEVKIEKPIKADKKTKASKTEV